MGQRNGCDVNSGVHEPSPCATMFIRRTLSLSIILTTNADVLAQTIDRIVYGIHLADCISVDDQVQLDLLDGYHFIV